MRLHPSNWPDVIKLDIPVEDPADLETIAKALADERFQTIGKPLGIIETLERLAKDIEEQWETLLKQYMLKELTATSYIYSRAATSPQVSPFAADINQVYEPDNVTPDSPMAEIDPTICFDVETETPASLSRRMFGPNKEIGSRFRFYVQVPRQHPTLEDQIVIKQFPVSARRKEHIILFKTYAHSGKEATLMAKGLDYYFELRREFLLGVGVQHHHVTESLNLIKEDSRTKMKYRELRLYMRLEEWFIGEEVPVISSPIYMEWSI